MVFVALICADERATFQIRTSSTAPAKNPDATLVVVSAEPMVVVTSFMPLTGSFSTSSFSRTPSR